MKIVLFLKSFFLVGSVAAVSQRDEDAVANLRRKLATDVTVDAALTSGTPSAPFNVDNDGDLDANIQLFKLTTPVTSGQYLGCTVTCGTGKGGDFIYYSIGNPTTDFHYYYTTRPNCVGGFTVPGRVIPSDGDLYIMYAAAAGNPQLDWPGSTGVVLSCTVSSATAPPTFLTGGPYPTPTSAPSSEPCTTNFALAAIRSISKYLGFGGSK